MRSKRLARYELLGEVRRDAGRILYEARDPLLNRPVAIEAVERGRAAESGGLNFETKVGLAGRLAHPNIASVYAAGSTRDVTYIATEWVDGGTLHDLLASGVPLPPAAIERIAAQVADGLDFMHRQGIVHGDVNPSTVLVLDIGFVKLSCLGNALFPVGWWRPADGGSAISPYASPEHVMGGALDGRSDIFSLGVLLYEMLAGVAPFSGSTFDELANEIVNKHPPAPSSVNPRIPTGFDYVVARALSKEPDHRYPSARDMASHLRRWALEDSTFFALPRTAAMPAQTADFRTITPSEDAPEHDAMLPARRRLLLYGIPGALLTMTAAWTMWTKPDFTPERTLRLDAAVANTPPPAASPSVQVGYEPPRATAQAVVEPASPAAAEPEPAAIEAPPVARLKLAVSPWGEIYVDGRKKGVSPPLREIELAPGRHSIEIRNAHFPPRRESVVLRADARMRIKHKFA